MSQTLIRQSASGTVLVTLTALFHTASLMALIVFLRWWALDYLEQTPHWLQSLLVFSTAVICILTLHGIEAWAWAWLYYHRKEFKDIESALYFSVVTTTTLGYGDFTLSHRSRLLASFQAMGGLIMFAASTAVLFEIFRQLIAQIV